ncbi:bifunctional protein FolD 2-like [Amaranthus tricolor]|uniref:bifunctional protein FolD 2-like n=1 Tax=Amaranthus tricolor TaxID=29722 RepID=UPI002586F711|nr:bifunctional protein FolD 2-like [Amaranthus tricolor]XP_057536387.1 bifunctional protein FolD 2-like [Amaranthus tricolor]
MRRERLLLGSILNNTPFISSTNSFSSSSIHSSHLQPFGKLKHLGFDLPDVWPSDTCSQPSPKLHFDGPSAKIIDGKSIAAVIKSQVASEVSRMKDMVGKHPGLAVVLVGERNDSHSFVRTKMKACDEVGISSSMVELHADCTEDEVLHVVSNLNRDPSLHGVLVQLPLPKHLNEEKILNVINPEKDVDGFHPFNMGSLAMKGREPFFVPCGAKSCIDLLLRTGVEMVGKNAVVIGRSKIVGLPVSLLLQRHHATVSIVHSFTKNPQNLTREADIIITDVGVPNMIRGNWLKQGAVVIDAGTNAVKDPNRKHGFHLTGDVCFEEAVRVASAITPVPGGVGPVTISMLLTNTFDSAKRAYGFV